MGFFDRLKTKKKQDEAPAEEVKTALGKASVIHKVTVNIPSYFKAGEGEYHLVVDGEDHISKPFGRISLELSEGPHEFHAYSTPETLGEAVETIEITADRILSVQVNVKDRTINIRCNDAVRSNKDFHDQFMEKNHIKNLEKEGSDRKNL